MSLTKITSTVINTLSSFFSINSSTGAITTNVPDLIGSNTTLYPSFACRAWVNFDGTKDTTGASSTSNTNRLIRASGNVASVLRNGTGDYTITFITAMPDINYCTTGAAELDSSPYAIIFAPNRIGTTGGESTPTTASVRVNSVNHNNYTASDTKYIFVTIFR
jgi:hypothetical protein